MDILVSICCTAYNHEMYITDALDGFLMQKANFNFEILISDDASTDKTAQMIEEYEKKFPDIIKPIYHTVNKYSKGVDIYSEIVWPKAKGKYIALCEGDDYWTDPYKLQKQVDYMESNPNCTLCFHNAKIIENGFAVTTNNLISNVIENNIYNAGEMAVLGFIPTASQFFRRTSIDNLPKWYNKAVVGDYPLQLITTSHGYAYYINEEMSVYRTGVKGSASSRASKLNVDKKIQYTEGFINILDNFNQYTNFKYAKLVDKAKIPWEVTIIVLKKDISMLKKERYNKYYNFTSNKNKIKLYCRCYFQSIYFKLADIKRIIKVKLLYNKK